MLNTMSDDPEIQVLWEESTISPSRNPSLLKCKACLRNKGKLGLKVPIFIHLNVINQYYLCLENDGSDKL